MMSLLERLNLMSAGVKDRELAEMTIGTKH